MKIIVSTVNNYLLIIFNFPVNNLFISNTYKYLTLIEKLILGIK